MPFRRFRAFRKRRTTRRPRRRYTRKRAGRPRRYNNKVHSYKRALDGVYDGSSVTNIISIPGGGGDYIMAPQFKLNDLPGVSELISLYDQYRINLVKLELIPQSNVNSFVGETIPYIHSVVDYDDSILLGSLNEAYEYESLKSTSAFRPHKRLIKPCFMNMGINTVSASVPINPRRGWISTAQSSIVHRGFKLLIEDSGSANVDLEIRVKTTFYLQFKNVK